MQKVCEAGLTLLGFARDGRAKLYTDDGRVLPESP